MSLGNAHPHDNEMWSEDLQELGAHAGFEGATKEHPAKPIAPEAEGSEHSEAATARKTVENGNREYRNKFKQLADDDSRQQLYDHQAAQQDDEAAQMEGLKSKAAKIIVDFQQRLPELEQLKQEDPKLYQSLTATMQTLLAMSAKMFGEPEQVQKAESSDDEPDFLDEIVAERTAKNPEFPEMVKKAEDKLHGGAGDDMEDVEFDPEQLKIGIKHELEHTQDRDIAEEIAKDHLCEDENYYTKLATIEKAGLLEAGKTGRHHLVLPVGSQIDASAGGTNKAMKIKFRDPETGKTKWRQVKAGMVMDDKGLPVSSRNQG